MIKEDFTAKPFHLWLQYIEEIELAIDYIAAERVPSWSQHFRCFVEILCMTVITMPGGPCVYC